MVTDQAPFISTSVRDVLEVGRGLLRCGGGSKFEGPKVAAWEVPERRFDGSRQGSGGSKASVEIRELHANGFEGSTFEVRNSRYPDQHL